jgi:hypothetical protein
MVTVCRGVQQHPGSVSGGKQCSYQKSGFDCLPIHCFDVFIVLLVPSIEDNGEKSGRLL